MRKKRHTNASVRNLKKRKANTKFCLQCLQRSHFPLDFLKWRRRRRDSRRSRRKREKKKDKKKNEIHRGASAGVTQVKKDTRDDSSEIVSDEFWESRRHEAKSYFSGLFPTQWLVNAEVGGGGQAEDDERTRRPVNEWVSEAPRERTLAYDIFASSYSKTWLSCFIRCPFLLSLLYWLSYFVARQCDVFSFWFFCFPCCFGSHEKKN